MSNLPLSQRLSLSLFSMALAASCSGCALLGHHQAAHSPTPVVDTSMMPRELNKTTLPPYVIEPPDILIVEAVHLTPKAPYRFRSGDSVALKVIGTLPEAPIEGIFVVEPGGMINLGALYGAVPIAGISREEAEKAITEKLSMTLKQPEVTVTINSMAGLQAVAGEHLVGPDGTITLGTYGSVHVVGMTLADAKAAIEAHLSEFLDKPEVSVDVFAYNSKAYYIITAGAGLGDQVVKFPITGNETVLDALSNVQGMSEVSSKRIWVARPSSDPTQVQVLPVDWDAIAARGSHATNYQLMPGDRLFIAEDNLVAMDTQLAKLLAPAERILGFSLLGVNTVTRFSGPVLRGGGQQGVLLNP